MTKKKPAPKTTEQSSTPPESTPATEQSSTAPAADGNGAPAVEPSKETAEPETKVEPKPKAAAPKAFKPKPCFDSLKVKAGSAVKYWLPLASATDKQIDATVTKVHKSGEKGAPPTVDLSYRSIAGIQTRESVRHVGPAPTFATRTGKWCEMTDPAAQAKAAAEEAKSPE